jgi:glycosyltransferase involved in cell wall biosynthesis
MAGPTIRFLGKLSDKEVIHYYTHCRAFIFPGEEDFGITPLEAQACGRPVIAYGAGGALATIIDGITGIFFHKQTVKSLMTALASFNEHMFNPLVIHNHALEFDISRFQHRILQFIETKMNERKLAQTRLPTNNLVS